MIMNAKKESNKGQDGEYHRSGWEGLGMEQNQGIRRLLE